MKTFLVRILPDADENLKSIFQWIHKDSPKNAATVINALEQTIMSLSVNPERFPTAYESSSPFFTNLNIRQVICKNHRIIYQITGDEVRVLAILNSRQDILA